MINLTLWIRATIDKILLNLCAKSDKLWIRWIHIYYIKGMDCTSYDPPQQCSWTLKSMFKFGAELRMKEAWREATMHPKYHTMRMYKSM